MYRSSQEKEKEGNMAWGNCGASHSDVRYPHQIVFLGEALEGHVKRSVKREPISADEFDDERPSKVVEQEGTSQFSFRDGKMHMMVDMESNELAAANVCHLADRAAFDYRQCPPQIEHLQCSVDVKEENLSDEEVVDVYPLGIEISGHGSEARVMGEFAHYEVTNGAEENELFTKTHGSCVFNRKRDNGKNFERFPNTGFAQQVDAAIVTNSAEFSRNEGSYMLDCQKAVASNRVSDEEEGEAGIADFGCQFDKENDVDELQDAEDSEFGYVDENWRAEDRSSLQHGTSLKEEKYITGENLKQAVSSRIHTVKGSYMKSGEWPLSHEEDAQHTEDYLYYDKDSSDNEDRESVQSLYEPSSHESDSDGNSLDYGPKPTGFTVQKKSKDHADRKLRRVSDGWKVDENRCSVCCCFFATKDDRSSHVCAGRNISCNICGKRVKDFDALQRHEKVHLELKPYICEICGKGFREKGNLTTHKRTHTKETPYECEHCNKKFADPSNFNRHRKSHLGLEIAKPCQCKFCGERFSRTANLLRHLVRFHKGEKDALNDGLEIGTEAEIPSKFKKLACSFCGKTFGKKEILQTHELLHEECQALTCKHCRRLLSSRDGLIQHLKIHGVQVDGKSRKEYICSFCGASFLSKLSLTGHERTHTKEWLHTCTVCSAHFTLKTSLNRHILTHSGMKPHGCDICKKRFLRAYDLTVHKRTHSKERPYTCDACGRGFAAQTNFSKHSKKCEAKTGRHNEPKPLA